MRRRAARDGGQLLILAGVVLILAFVISAFAVSELATEQQKLQRGPDSELPKLFREVRDKVAGTMHGLSFGRIENATLMAHFDSTRAELEQQGRSHGVHTVLRLANATDAYAVKTERANFTAPGGGAAQCPDGNRTYALKSHNGSRDWTGKAYDCADDGIVWDMDERKASGLVVYLFMADRSARIEETLAIALNKDA